MWLGAIGAGCTDDTPKEIPVWRVEEDPIVLEGDLYPEERDRAEILTMSDMVLLYGGGHHRTPYAWSAGDLADYVTYTDTDSRKHWLFDGFLLLEFMDAGAGGAGKTFVTGYTYEGVALPSADKSDWQRLIDYYFASGSGVDALEAAVGAAVADLGAPTAKRRIVIGVPEPIRSLYSSSDSGGTTYWGQLDGRTLDFSNEEDRAAACKWYVDCVRERFHAKNYRYVELAGFYWVAEKSTQSREILPPLSDYLAERKYSFEWIPYFNADGYTQWASFGFSHAYLQPNYFFNESVPYSRLEEACEQAVKLGMDLEVEFDGNALNQAGRAYRLRDYMEVFRRTGVWETKRLAYYQGSWALRWLKSSGDAADRQLYHDFCRFVIERPMRDTH